MSLWSQEEKKFVRVVAEDGDFQSIVYCISQDSFGNIWAGTEEGVVRFNSVETFLYNRYQGLPGEVTNRISALFIDSQNQIWIGTEKGLCKYNALQNVFEYIPTTKDRTPKLVEVIVEDEQQNIWIGAYNGLWKYDAFKEGEEKKLIQVAEDVNVLSICVDHQPYLIGTGQGLFSVAPESNTIKPVVFQNDKSPLSISSLYLAKDHLLLGTMKNGLFKSDLNFSQLEEIPLMATAQRNAPIKQITPDENGNIYLATDGAGLLYLNEEYQFLSAFTNDVNNTNSINSNGIYDLFLGIENILWIATYGGGVNRLRLANDYFHYISHQLNNSNSITHNFTRSILEDQEGRIWFGTKAGISIWNRKDNQWKHLSSLKSPSNTPDIILDLEEDGAYVWVTTFGNGAFKVNKQDFSVQQYSSNKAADVPIGLSKIYAVLVDSKGNCWLGGIDGSLHRIAKDGTVSTYPTSQIRMIQEARDGSVLIVGRNGVQQIKDEQLIELEALRSGQNGLDYSTVSCIHEDRNGVLTIGTNGGGLVFFDPSDESVRTINRKNGLTSNVVQGILYENPNSLWASTTRGLVNITMTEKDTTIMEYNKGDGLISSEYNYGSFTKLSTGEMIFGGVDGLTFFNPLDIGKQEEVPKVVLEEFKVFDQENTNGQNVLPQSIHSLDEIALRYDQNTLSIKFVGILNSAPEKVRYSWKMEGMTDRWSAPNTERQINFANLSPGEYLFKIKATNRDGVWSPARALKIEIAPPWWASTLAYVLYFLLGIAMVLGVIYLAGVFINKRNAEEQIAFFNNITHELKTPLSILLSTLETAPKSTNDQESSNKKIKTTISRLNTLFDQLLNFHKVTSGRYQTHQINKIHLRSHLEQVINSFKPLLEKSSVSIQVNSLWEKEVFYYDKDIFDKILFNLLSNAVKYSKENGNIEVVLKNGKKTDLKLSVVDNGIGIPGDQQKFILKRYYRGRNAINSQMPGTGLGLMIVKSLVERDKGSIEFNSVENEGTTFTVNLKDQEAHYNESALISESETKTELPENTKMAEFSDAKILIVEDNDELRSILVERIGTYFQVYEAENGQKGLDAVGEVFPDLIITDLIMPEMDGMAMSQALQKDINLNHIPIFMMTVLNNSTHKIESIESGITAYMEKPIDFDFLLAKIVSTLAWQKNLRERYLHQVDIDNAEKFRNERDAGFISNLENFVLEKIKEEGLSVHDLCRHVGMSRTALYMKLKNMVDLSPQNFIIHTRLKYARKLLLEGDINVKEVAYLAGFANPKYFSTSFKKLFGQSPTSFMKSLQSDQD